MREKLLIVFVGILIGLFVGFVFANNIRSRPASMAAAQMPAEVSNALANARNNPGSFEAQIRAAELYYQIQRYDDALAYLLRANQLQPDSFEAIASLGMVNMDAGHLEDAEKWLKLALARQSDNPMVLSAYCALLLQRGNLKAAGETISRLEAIDPTNSELPEFRSQLRILKSK
ncbi:MAG TPA: tetratricopeptide repeat protein [Terriglobia bacterium]|nr:tetratricopeptide repeat protein [Terriglobia bacterium]